jgi:hypothetical protein
MRRMAFVSTFALFAALTVVVSRANALTADFSTVGPAGRMTGSSVSINHVTAEAFYLDTTTNIYVNKDAAGATNTFLMVRNIVGDRGLGVCSPGEYGAGTACNPPGTYPGGGGDTNELDNSGKRELIRLKIDNGWDWQSVSVSSLDTAERGELRWSSGDLLTLANVTGSQRDRCERLAPAPSVVAQRERVASRASTISASSIAMNESISSARVRRPIARRFSAALQR